MFNKTSYKVSGDRICVTAKKERLTFIESGSHLAWCWVLAHVLSYFIFVTVLLGIIFLFSRFGNQDSLNDFPKVTQLKIVEPDLNPNCLTLKPLIFFFFFFLPSACLMETELMGLCFVYSLAYAAALF